MFVQWMAWGFTIMSLLMIPSIVSNSESGYLTTEAKSNIDYLTPANQKATGISSNSLNQATKISTMTYVWRGLLVGGDGLYCVFFIFFCLSL